jgi:hypothetical protein
VTPYREAKLTERFLQLFRTLRMRTAERWKPLGENLLYAGALFAKETTDLHDETDWTPTGRKIASPWLSPALVKDRIITADALHT